MWQIVLILALVTFVGSRFIHPARAKEFMALGKVVGEKVTEKRAVRKKLERRAEVLKRTIRELQRMPATSPTEIKYRNIQLAQLKAELAEVEGELENL